MSTSIWLQKSALIQKRTSSLKFAEASLCDTHPRGQKSGSVDCDWVDQGKAGVGERELVPVFILNRPELWPNF